MTTTRHIVCAAGSQTKWGNHLGLPSHFAPLAPGEGGTVLGRILGQLSQFDDVILTAPPEVPNDPYSVVVRQHNPKAVIKRIADPMLNEFENTMGLWNNEGRTTLILGDVFFTHEAMGRIISSVKPLMFFGRADKSKIIQGSKWGEIFAYSWIKSYNRYVVDATAKVHIFKALGEVSVANGWRIFRQLTGLPLEQHDPEVLYTHCFWSEINDFTDDIDFRGDFENHPMMRKGQL